MPTGTKGIWPKARLWGAAARATSRGRCCSWTSTWWSSARSTTSSASATPDEVILARNPNTPFERLGQTSLFRFPVGKLVPLQERFLADPQGVADTYQFEQRFVTREAPGGVALLARALGAALPHRLRPRRCRSTSSCRRGCRRTPAW